VSSKTPSPEELEAAGSSLEAARAYEARRSLDDALRCFQAANAWPEAARIQVQLRRFEDAAASFLRVLPTQMTPVEQLSPRALKSAFQAAVCYSRCNRVRHAVALFINLGEFARAAEVLRRAGRRADAAQAARGRPLPDSPWPSGFLSSGQSDVRRSEPTPPEEPLARADRLVRDGKRRDALATLQGIGHLHPTYPDAVGRASDIAWSEDVWTPELDEFVAPFLAGDASGRHHAAHAPALYRLGRIFQRLSLNSSAAAAFDAVVSVVPSYRDAQLRLAELQPFHFHPDVLEDSEADLSLPSFGGILADDLPGRPLPPPSKKMEPLPVSPHDPGPNLATPPAPVRVRETSPSSRRVPPPRTSGSHTGRRTPAALKRAVAARSQELGLGPVGPGSVIGERYLVQEPLGEGGYAVVFKVRDLELNESIALKMFTPKDADERSVKRFRREMRIARQLVHPNIVASYEFGTYRGAYFITMEMLKGKDMYSFAEDVHWGMVPVDLALDLAGQSLDGLGAAHDQGIVHRDVKLRNLFVLGETNQVKVMDFGIATVTGAGTGLTRTGMVVGTPAFVAPERLKPKPDPPTPAVDIYAVGVVLYRLLTGVLPFDRRSVAALFSDILTRDPRPVSALNIDVPPDVEAIVSRMLAKDPGDRFTNCATARQAIDAARMNLARMS
jgi:tRNA A-37 threonylcarbamoyl transferase component Bud32/tetratricopeptide (TPR) repeat protein